MKSEIIIEEFNGRRIAIRGIGKMFYQDGFPISIAISEFKKQGVEVSIFHVADECLKNGWSAKTTYNKLKTDFEDDIDRNKIDFCELEKFCYADYESQRGIIFNYLFNTKDAAIVWAKNRLL